MLHRQAGAQVMVRSVSLLFYVLAAYQSDVATLCTGEVLHPTPPHPTK